MNQDWDMKVVLQNKIAFVLSKHRFWRILVMCATHTEEKALSSTTSRAFFRSGKCKDDCPSFLINHVYILFFNYYWCKTNWTKLLRTLVSLPRRSHIYHDDCVCRFYHQWHWILYLHHPICKLKVCIGYTWKRVMSTKSVTSHSLAYHVIKL